MSLLAVVILIAVSLSPAPRDRPDQQGQTKENERSPSTQQANPSSVPVAVSEQQSKDGENKQDAQGNHENSRWSITDVINCISTAVMAVFTIVLAIYTIKLWTSGEARSEIELRAYVYHWGGMVHKPVVGEKVMVTVVLRNSGQTPAYKIKRRSYVWIGDQPSPNRFPEKEWSIDNPFIGPGGSEGHYFMYRPEVLTKDEYSGLLSGRLILFFAAEFAYESFRKPHWLKCKGYFRNKPGRALDNPTYPYINTEDWNEIDCET